MKLPQDIWQLRGAKGFGPNVTVLGGTHGDELAGIEIIKKLLVQFNLLDKPSGIYDIPNINGNIFVGFGNPRAIEKYARSASGLRDLNRSFIKKDFTNPDKTNKIADLKRARELAPLLEKTDFLFDIHATSNPAPQFVCLNTYTPEYQKYLDLMPIEKILIDPNQIITKEFNLPEPGTTDYYVFKYGGSSWSIKKYGHKKALALCYETGYQSDLSRLDEIFLTILNLIDATGVTKHRMPHPPSPTHKQIYKLSHCVKARYNDFTYAKDMDKGWQKVKRGQILGKYTNGQYEKIIQDGTLLFPLGVSKIKTGKALYWLANKI